MKSITYGACELKILYYDKDPAIFIDPGTPENIKIISGTKNGIVLSKLECRFLEKHHQDGLIKSYKESEVSNEKIS